MKEGESNVEAPTEMPEVARYNQMGSAMIACHDTFTGKPAGAWVEAKDYDSLRSYAETLRGQAAKLSRECEEHKADAIAIAMSLGAATDRAEAAEQRAEEREKDAEDAVAVLREIVEALRRYAPGTPLNSHTFDALGSRANAIIAKRDAALQRPADARGAFWWRRYVRDEIERNRQQPASPAPESVSVPVSLLREAYRGLKRHYEMPEVRKQIDALLTAARPHGVGEMNKEQKRVFDAAMARWDEFLLSHNGNVRAAIGACYTRKGAALAKACAAAAKRGRK